VSKKEKEKEYKLNKKKIEKRIHEGQSKGGFEWAIEQQGEKIIITPMHECGIVIHGREEAKFFCKVIIQCFR